MSIGDMDKSEQKEMKKIRTIKNTCHDWSTIYIPEPIIKSVGVFKDQFLSIFKVNTSRQSTHKRRKKLSKPKTRIEDLFLYKKQEIKYEIIKDIFSLFETEEEKTEEGN